MPGAGSSPAGLTPARSLPAPGSPPRTATYPRAIQFQAQILGYPMDENGLFLDVHPVDQRVPLKLAIAAGKLASNPEIGSTLRDVRPGLASTAAQAKDAVRTALADELKAQEISLVSVDVESTSSGVFLSVVYINLITQKTQPTQTRIG